MKIELIATATFGLEAVVRREVESLGYKVIKTEDGKVTYTGDERAIVRSNLWLRAADRVHIKMAEFRAETFEELFQQTKALDWGNIISPDGEFTVTGTSVKSKLHSVPACQSICKKAVAEKLGEFYGVETLPETGGKYTIKITILKDNVTVTIDTSGTGLHKRGYRVANVPAPIKETLAAALIQLSYWNSDRLLVDPCCGSATIPIEAAMIGRNIAPGLSRKFASEEWEFISEQIWKDERKTARSLINYDKKLQIYAFDKDKKAIHAAKQNALEAGVEDDLVIKVMDVSHLKAAQESGIIITNPPYGQRIGEQEEIDRIFKFYNRFFKNNPTWSLFVITTDKKAESKIFSRKADRRRKLYNGRLEACYYQFHGKKPNKNINESSKV